MTVTKVRLCNNLGIIVPCFNKSPDFSAKRHLQVNHVGVFAWKMVTGDQRVRRRCYRGVAGKGKRLWGCSSSKVRNAVGLQVEEERQTCFHSRCGSQAAPLRYAHRLHVQSGWGMANMWGRCCAVNLSPADPGRPG